MKLHFFHFACFLLMLCSQGQGLGQVTHTVTTTADSGPGSLRDAMHQADLQTVQPDEIVFSLPAGPQNITLFSDLIPQSRMEIRGPSAAGNRITLRGSGTNRIVTTFGDAAVTWKNLDFADGRETTGGAAYVNGNTFINCTFYNNIAEGTGGAVQGAQNTFEGCTFRNNSSGYNGGAINSTDHSLTIRDCIFHDNESNYGGAVQSTSTVPLIENSAFYNNTGGAIDLWFDGLGTLRNLSVYNNTSEFTPGGIHLYGGGGGSIVNCTISGNESEETVGGIRIGGGSFHLINCTITNNTGFSVGTTYPYAFGGLEYSTYGQYADSLEVGNCILAGNFATPGNGGVANPYPDVYAPSNASSLGGNFIGDGSNSSVFVHGVNGDQVGTRTARLNPLLEPLASIGGLGQHHNLAEGSPCQDAGIDALVIAPDFVGPPYQDALLTDRIKGDAVDCGAIESGGTILVRNTNDSGAGSLRQAIIDANVSGGKRITFSKGGGATVDFHTSQQTINLTSGEISVTNSVTISAPAVGVRIGAGGSSRLFNINTATLKPISFKQLILRTGTTTGNGGAILVTGAADVTIKKCSLQNCSAALGGAAAVSAGAILRLHESSLINNSATSSGGALLVDGGTLYVTNSTISNNSAVQQGGGAHVQTATALLHSINSTWTENIADADANNTGNGGGINVADGTARLANSLVAGNIDSSPTNLRPDLAGTFITEGNNLIGAGTGVVGFTHGVSGDQVGTNAAPILPLLGPLQGNGGFTTTHTLAVGSPARDAGGATPLSASIWPEAPVRDQRGQFRVLGSAVDIGAVEGVEDMVVKLSSDQPTSREFGLTAASLQLERSFATGDMTVRFQRFAGTGSLADFQLSHGSLSQISASTWEVVIPDGKLKTNVEVVPVNDLIDEITETVTFSLIDQAAYNLDSSSSYVISIEDDDIVVTNGNDSGAGSLRQAIMDAEAIGGAQISFANPSIEVGLNSSLVIDSSMEIIGSMNRIKRTSAANFRPLAIEGSSGGCVVLRKVEISGGQTTSGGGLLVTGPATCALLEGCRITGNTATTAGGGIRLEDGQLELRDSSVDGNTSSNGGGGISTLRGFLDLVNVVIANNLASGNGGGVSMEDTNGTVVHSTLSNNTCDSNSDGFGDGGGLWTDSDDDQIVLVINCILAGNFDSPSNNTGTSRRDVFGDFISGGGNYVGSNAGGETQFPVGAPNANTDWAGTNTSALNPLLVEVTGTSPLEFEPQPGSNTIDHGNASVVVPPSFPATNPTDLRGQPRIVGTAPDMGAIETNYFIVTNANNGGAGSLRQAVSGANAQGFGTVTFLDSSFPTATSITLQTQVSLTGAGRICIRGKRGDPDYYTVRGNGSDRVFQVSAGEVIFKDLTIANGNAQARAVAPFDGGAVHASGAASLSFDTCVVKNNSGNSGGGVLADGVPVVITDTYFFNNTATTLAGGGLNILNAAALTATGSTFEQNSATTDGGALSANGGAVTLSNCTLSANTANGHGGGIAMTSGGSLQLVHGTITANIADNDTAGGGDGGGISNVSAALTLTNSIVAGNTDRTNEAPDLNDSGTTILNYSLLGNNTGSTVSPTTPNSLVGSGSVGIPPRLAPLADNGGRTKTHRLRGGSPAFGAGSSALALTTDQRGQPRAGLIDLGAYELPELNVTTTSAHLAGSLRDLLLQAPSLGHCVIHLNGGTHISNPSYAVTSSVWLRGTGNATLGANQLARVLDINTATDAEIVMTDLWFRAGTDNSGNGGLIRAAGGGQVEMLRCTLELGAALQGGGMYVDGGTAYLENCTLTNCSALTNGGGLHFKNSTAALYHCTITNNRAAKDGLQAGSGSGVYQEGGTLALSNNILAGNVTSATLIGSPDFARTVGSTTPRLGKTLLGSNTGVTGLFPAGNPNVNGDFVNVDARLAPFGATGSGVYQHALYFGSPAVDAGSGTPPSLFTDGRSVIRNSGAADLGAYELQEETYEYWTSHVFAFNTTSERKVATYDHDGDGFANGVEYAMGTNPSDRSSKPALTPTTTGNTFSLDFSLSPLAPRDYLRLRLSADLQTWGVPRPITDYTSLGIDPLTQTELVRLTLTRIGFPKRFVRAGIP